MRGVLRFAKPVLVLRLQESSNFFYRVPEQEGGFTENLLNRKTDRMHSNVESRMLKRTIFRIVCVLLTATKHTMQELKPVERPDSGTGEASGNHPVGHIGQVQVKPILLVPGKKGLNLR